MSLYDFDTAGRSGASALLDACTAADQQLQYTQRIRAENTTLHTRIQQLETENNTLREQLEDWEWEHKDDRPRAVQRV